VQRKKDEDRTSSQETEDIDKEEDFELVSRRRKRLISTTPPQTSEKNQNFPKPPQRKRHQAIVSENIKSIRSSLENFPASK
jgi:hypothetical protein